MVMEQRGHLGGSRGAAPDGAYGAKPLENL